MSRIGVFICHCGENIGGTVDCGKVAECTRNVPGVVHSVDYKYMCSDPGQSMIKDAIKEHNLTGVVVAACSPRMHEPTFRSAVAEAGLNPYLCEMANLREHCSWVHPKGEATTDKAADLVPGLAQLLAPRLRVVGHALGTLLPAEGSEAAFLAERTLLKRIGEPADLCRAVRFAAASPFLTGEILTQDGGRRWVDR